MAALVCIVDEVVESSIVSAPMVEIRSGVGVPNLCVATGELSPSPVNKNCTPRSLANLSEISTIKASTKT